ncbi:MAG TPA: DJ-1/PfpI family protein [Pseudomonadales bacterium]|nr:DJ-1/PfpI family protein [Pseudomonadales bacterium]
MTNEASRPLTLGVILYPGFELLDVFGPLEMFAAVGRNRLVPYIVAERAGPVPAGTVADGHAGPRVVADFGFDDAPELDVLLLPGGIGTFPELENEKMLAFLRDRSRRARITTSVCTGSALLAKAGVLDGLRATTNKMYFSLGRQQSNAVEWVEAARWVDAGAFVTSSGVSAGIDMALAVIARLFGTETAEQIAIGTEYTWHRDPNDDPFVQYLDYATRA